MKRRDVLIGAAALPGLAKAAARRPPNFVLILCDDLGYGDIEPYGGPIPTPNLVRLAREGLTCTDYYSPANLCTPARAGLLTGRYPIRCGLGYEVISVDDTRALPHAERTIADALRPAGYVSGLFGKWHLGHMAADWMPIHYGFDAFFGLPYSHDMSPLEVWTADQAGIAPSKAPPDYPALQQQFYDHAERFIEANATRPFFCELAFSAPHLPEYPHSPYRGTTKQGAFGDVVRELDALAGRLMAKLRALKLERDTIVIFTSDNGPWFEGSSGPLRDRKGGAGFDGGYRVPFIVWAPGRTPAGRKTKALVNGVDVLPTFCALAGIAPPAGVELDGVDQSRLFEGGPSAREEVVLFNNEDVAGIRTVRWKYVAQSYYRGLTLPLDRWGPELYDMSAPGLENYSLAQNHPDEVKDMQRRFARAKAKYAPFKKGIPPAIQRQRERLLAQPPA
jgi:arylsulfatase A-like enzyme